MVDLTASDRPVRSQPVWPAWLLGWLGCSVLALINGGLRERVYQDRVGPMQAHYLSTGLLFALLGASTRLLDHYWPIRTRRTAGVVALRSCARGGAHS